MGKLRAGVAAEFPFGVCERPSSAGTWCCLVRLSTRLYTAKQSKES